MSARHTQSFKFGRIHLALVAATLTVGALGVWGWTHAHAGTAHLYTSAGYGGYVGADRKPRSETPLQRASEAYSAGKLAAAEQIANDVILQASGLPSNLQAAHEALLAKRILAYASARRSRFAEAKTRFGALRQAAYESPDHGRQRVALGEVAPTLEEEGAFEAAVCTGALGDKQGEEREMDGFMRTYPQSILIHAAVKRIARLHGGDVPKYAEATWKAGMAVQKAADEAQRKSEALCGPECLAELLKRQGKSAEVSALAAEMQTSGEGTSLASMQQTAKRHGLKLQGVALSAKGLAKQRLPILALITPGHYVLVEAVTPAETRIWDPDARGVGVGGKRSFTTSDWTKAWNGVALR